MDKFTKNFQSYLLPICLILILYVIFAPAILLSIYDDGIIKSKDSLEPFFS